MNAKIITVGVVVGLCLILFILFNFSTDDVATVPEENIPQGWTPSTNTSSVTIPLLASNNLEFQVSNFIDNGETVADPVNAKHYILAGSLGYCLPDGVCPSGFAADNFSVSYNEEDNFFTLSILTEPIAESRKEAEVFLMSRLGIGEQEMCQLHYSFSIPHWVNEFYAGRELGFSFCPGSVSLE